jgi:NADH dehydrogenase/NADH:ubiquinone oxidoreductase subunit G
VPKVLIDGKEVIVEQEQTILDAARKAGVWIPTLCFIPAISAPASCRLCMVELERKGREGQLVTACNYPVRGDIVVRVSSEKAARVRRGVMELLLARSPESLELKALASRMGVNGTPYPKVTESERNCVLCGICTRVCEEVIGVSAISFVGRGVDRMIATPFKLASDDCIACGACAAVCPVGTIQVKIHAESGEAEISPFKSRVKLLMCEECGKRMVSVPVSNLLVEKVHINWDEFKKRAKLCPDCRRKLAAKAMSLGIDRRP